MTTSRKSKQRDAILENLLARHDHPTSEEVYLSIRESMPNISLATVYRNLYILLNEGKVKAIHGPDAVHYDADMKNHRHVICTGCGKIFDIDIDVSSELIELAKQKFDGSINDCKIIFYGLCKNCKEKNINSEE
ncbi:MAG: transcriptional repressor [Acutalibacteraceae bacterium]|nr:transcriptional repressor [Oscillospiraceae bacterium]